MNKERGARPKVPMGWKYFQGSGTKESVAMREEEGSETTDVQEPESLGT
jgi:hypothetical protein